MRHLNLWFAVIALAMCVAPAQGQTIYKCDGPNGTKIYSQLPCAPAGGKQQEVQLKASKPATQTESDVRRTQEIQRSAAMTAAARQEQNCLAQIDGVWNSANRRIKDSEARIAALDQRAARARNNLAGATWEAGMREEIAGLHQAIATERATATAQESDIRRRCTEQRQAADAEVQRTFAPPPASAPGINP